MNVDRPRDRIGPLLQSTVVVIALRGLTLLSRFSLNIFIAKYMSLSDLGEYGLIAGVIAIIPNALSFGLMNRIGRNAVTSTIEDTTRELLQYWIFVAMAYCAIGGIAGAVAIHQGYGRQAGEIFALTITEHFCGDAFLILMSVKRPIVANLLMFGRLGVSAVAFMALSLIARQLRNIPMLVIFMAAANIFCALLFFATTATWPWSRAVASLRVNSLKDDLKGSFTLYLNDMLNTFGQYVDRIFVSSYLGLELTGVYVLFWSVGNAMSTLVGNGVILVHRHAVIYSQRKYPASTPGLLINLVRSTLISSVVIGSVGVAFLYAISLYLGKIAVSDNLYVLGLIMAGFVIRMVYEAIGVGLYSGRQDGASFLTSLLVLSLTLLLDALAVPWLGLSGAGAVIIVAYTFGALSRWYLVQRWFDRSRSLNAVVSG